MAREIDRFEVQRLLREGAQLVEVLPASQYEQRHIAGAINIPLKDIRHKAREQLDAGKAVITYCYDSLCDMSPRAAAILEHLGFGDVYDYKPSKVDWMSHMLPAEGTDTATRLADLAREVPTCHPEDKLEEVAGRLGDADICLVVNERNILLGLLRGEALAMRDGRTAADVMQEGPKTHRPDVTATEMAQLLQKKPEARIIVTGADGLLYGVTTPQEVDRAATEQSHG